MGVTCLCNDPPLRDITGDNRYCDLEDVLQADIISLHVPLTGSGSHPTRQMVNDHFIAQMRPGTVLINTSRGPVVDEAALKQALQQRDFPVVLDVWADDPAVDPDLLRSVVIGTPHIAGYSSDARLRATAMIHRRLCEHLKVPGAWRPGEKLAGLPSKIIGIDAGSSLQDGLEMAILSHYDVRSDAAVLHQSVSMPAPEAMCYFDDLRKNYPVRREFDSTTIRLSGGKLAGMLGQLGFNIVTH